MREVIHKHCCRFRHCRNSILLDLSIRREDTFCKTLNHSAGKRKVLEAPNDFISEYSKNQAIESRNPVKLHKMHLASGQNTPQC